MYISSQNIEELYTVLDSLKKDDILVISGSIPDSLPDDMYERIMARLQGRGIHIIVDATKNLLVKTLPGRPFLIKPNNHELGEIFGVELKKREEVVPYARKLQDAGARNVLVSMAGEGAVLAAENGVVYMSKAPEGAVINSVGAGDSMVAGFIAGYIESEGDYLTAFQTGICAGSASAFSEELATKEQMVVLRMQLQQEA